MLNQNLIAQGLQDYRLGNPVLGDLGNLSGSQFFQGFLRGLVNFGLIVGAVIFLFMLLLGAIQWISSGGDKANVEAARSRLTTALIGLVLLFAVFAIINVIDTFFGTEILRLDIPSIVIQ